MPAVQRTKTSTGVSAAMIFSVEAKWSQRLDAMAQLNHFQPNFIVFSARFQDFATDRRQAVRSSPPRVRRIVQEETDGRNGGTPIRPGY
jgi:hypothetical protein